MLPALYDEEGGDDRYAGAVYVQGSSDDSTMLYSATYGPGDGSGVGIYGGQGYGAGDQYGGGDPRYSAGGAEYSGGYGTVPVGGRGLDEAYGALLDSVDPFDYLDERSSYGTAGDGRYVVPAGTGGYGAVEDEQYVVSPSTWVAEFELDWDYT